MPTLLRFPAVHEAEPSGPDRGGAEERGAVVQVLSDAGGELRTGVLLERVQEATSKHRATVYRWLGDLEREGVIEQPRHGVYRLRRDREA